MLTKLDTSSPRPIAKSARPFHSLATNRHTTASTTAAAAMGSVLAIPDKKAVTWFRVAPRWRAKASSIPSSRCPKRLWSSTCTMSNPMAVPTATKAM
jgi:hypothetical protein